MLSSPRGKTYDHITSGESIKLIFSLGFRIKM